MVYLSRRFNRFRIKGAPLEGPLIGKKSAATPCDRKTGISCCQRQIKSSFAPASKETASAASIDEFFCQLWQPRRHEHLLVCDQSDDLAAIESWPQEVARAETRRNRLLRCMLRGPRKASRGIPMDFIFIFCLSFLIHWISFETWRGGLDIDRVLMEFHIKQIGHITILHENGCWE